MDKRWCPLCAGSLDGSIGDVSHLPLPLLIRSHSFVCQIVHVFLATGHTCARSRWWMATVLGALLPADSRQMVQRRASGQWRCSGRISATCLPLALTFLQRQALLNPHCCSLCLFLLHELIFMPNAKCQLALVTSDSTNSQSV